MSALPNGRGQAWRDLNAINTTILLLSVDEAPMLARSLPAAIAQGPGTEVVVIDNACSDATAGLAADHGARCLHLPARRSYAAAINHAFARTAGDAVLLLNADCVLEPGFLAAALPRLATSGVGSVTPKLLQVRDFDSPAGPTPIDAAGMFLDRRRKNGLVGHGAPAEAFHRCAPAFGADGAAALYRREALEDCRAAGGELLDEDMGLWATDADLAWRARLLGWDCVYEPGARARHVRTYSPSTRNQISQRHRRVQFRNRLLMMVKNETRAGFRRDGLRICAYELLALGHVLLREPHLLGGYLEAWRLLPAARRRRRGVQERSRVSYPPFGLRPPA